MVSSSVADAERTSLISALGLSATVGAGLSLMDLRRKKLLSDVSLDTTTGRTYSWSDLKRLKSVLPSIPYSQVAHGTSAMNAGASKSITLPGTVQAGDLIVLWGGVSNSAATALRNINTVPSAANGAWTTPGQQQKASSTRSIVAQLFYKVAVSADAGATYTIGFDGSDISWLQYAVYRGVSSTLQAGPTLSNLNNSLTHAAATVTATKKAHGVALFASCVGGYFDGVITTANVDTKVDNPGSNSTSACLAEYLMAGAGDSPNVTGTRAANNSNCAWVSANLLLSEG